MAQMKTYRVNKENGVKIGKVRFRMNSIVTENEAHKNQMRRLASIYHLIEVDTKTGGNR